MQLGVIGLGRMGANVARHLVEQGIGVVAWNRSVEPRRELEREGAVAVDTPQKLAETLTPPRVILIFLPAGNVVDEVIEVIQPTLTKGDIIIDGGNSFFRDSVRRGESLEKQGIHFLDVGTSGGLAGARHGACLTIGGDEEVFKACEWVFKSVSQPQGYAYVGPSGAGHYVKMVHNGIEYALLQTYGEGFQVLAEGPYKDLDLGRIADVWSHGSIIRSYLTELAAQAFKRDPRLEQIEGNVRGGETGMWTVREAKKARTPTPMIALAIHAREQSQTTPTFATKVVAVLRSLFGGHTV